MRTSSGLLSSLALATLAAVQGAGASPTPFNFTVSPGAGLDVGMEPAGGSVNGFPADLNRDDDKTSPARSHMPIHAAQKPSICPGNEGVCSPGPLEGNPAATEEASEEKRDFWNDSFICIMFGYGPGCSGSP